MTKTISKGTILAMFMFMFVTVVLQAIHPASGAVAMLTSHHLSEIASAALVGGVNWGQLGAGIACGAGIVAIAGGALSGVGTPAAILAVSGVAGCCVAAIG